MSSITSEPYLCKERVYRDNNSFDIKLKIQIPLNSTTHNESWPSVSPLLYILQTPRRAVLVLLLITSLIWLPIIRGTYFSLDTDWLVFSNPVLQQSQFPSLYLDFSKGNRLTLGAEYLPVRDIFVWF